MTAIAAFLCRWASCKGSLPQPFVVFFLAASGLCAPRRRKFMTLGLALVGLRTVAELLHGYTHGDVGWCDEAQYTRRKRNESDEKDRDKE